MNNNIIQQEIITLTNKLGFESKFFTSKPWKYNTNEYKRYLLWLEEIKLWLLERYSHHIVLSMFEDTKDDTMYWSYRLHHIKSVKLAITPTTIHRNYRSALECGVLSGLKIIEGLLIGAGIALIIEQKASLAGAVGGCQAETGSAAAMAAGAIVYCLEGSTDQVFTAVAITIQCMLGLVCDPVAGLVEVPCVVRNASAAAIAFSSAQIALASVNAVIPVDECIEAMGEIGASMESRYKETAMGGLAATLTGQEIAKRILINDIEILPDPKLPD